MNPPLSTHPGSPLPLGANIRKNGVQFALFSRHAESVTLVLFESERPDSPSREIELDPVRNKTGDIWHILVEGLKEGQVYGYRVGGKYEPLKGLRFNKNMLLVDPYARAITNGHAWDFTKARAYDPASPEADLSFSCGNSAPFVPRSMVLGFKLDRFDKPLNLLKKDSIIYELHVRGYTIHESSGSPAGGTYRGLTDKIPYLKELGVTAVELMPVQEFDENENININPLSGERLKNYWGYSTISFFAAKGGYASCSGAGRQVTEFKEMVKSFHEAGIEVILDVVFNHTSEGDRVGPTVSFRGIDNTVYYILENEKRYYKNYSGCGNTFNCNHPFVRDFILDCLRYWVVEMNVDGFRFDLASILGRDQDGRILGNPVLIERISEDPILRNTKIIAEAWDAAGAYQVGQFPGRWAEWNGKYRDDVRRFWRGDRDAAGAFATRITGSSDLYGHSENGPSQSINFVCCHDGFTLSDLVSYNHKHNIENGEDNRDGENHNLSCSYGMEGPARSPYLARIRDRQIKNFIATLFLSQGIPMLMAGDEFRRTQKGNNNCYCQDNELSWVDWSLLGENTGLFEFTREMIRFRKEHPSLRRTWFFNGIKDPDTGAADITWHGPDGNGPDWGPDCRTVALCINGELAVGGSSSPDSDILAIFHSSMEHRPFLLPPSPSGRPWQRAVDTALPGDEIRRQGEDTPFEGKSYHVKKLSVVVFTA